MAKSDYYRNKDDKITFSIISPEVLKRLKKDKKLPARQIDVEKDESWNMKKLTSKLIQGIQNGDSIPKITASFMDVIENNRKSAVRAARTMTTSAECHGRMDSYQNLAQQGVVQKKHWIATPDDRTRASHLELDGQERDIDEEFSNGLMFPGDGDGDPAEIWNCRCSIATRIVGFRKADGHIDYVDRPQEPESLHEKQIEQEKEKRQKDNV